MNRKFQYLLGVLVGAAVLLSACAPAATPAPEPTVPAVVEPTTAPTQPVATDAPTAAAAPTEKPVVEGILPMVDPSKFSGKVVTAGSSTVFPLAEVMAERFKEEGFSGDVTIDSIGSGAGLERFCKTGETDVANSSRKIKDSETENCKVINRSPLQFRIGTDAIAVVVSSENDFLKDVSMEELGKIWSSKVTKWSDVRPEWPNEDIKRFSPGTDSGTFDYFVEKVTAPNFKTADGKDDIKAGEADLLKTSNAQFSEDDNVLVQGVEGSKYAIGYFGYAYLVENQGKLRAIAINSIAPTAETAENGKYPLSRPLFLYSDAKIIKDKPQVGAYINFFLTYVNDEIGAVGYFPASDEALNEARTTLAGAMK